MPAEPGSVAKAVLAALAGGRQLQPFTSLHPDFSPSDAYAVTAALRRLRVDRGATQIGRKIGFTNRGIWPEYGVFEPIWGDIYDDTVHAVTAGERIAVMHLPEPRIEPEIVLGLEADLRPDMSVAEIAAAVAWIAHGFEFVQSIFPDWRFRTADCIADGGLHGALFVGPRRAVDRGDRSQLPAMLSALRVAICRDGELMDEGVGANVLDGPIEALAHLVGVLGRDPRNPPLRAGEMVTTGTLTRAFPVCAGERWSTRIEGTGTPGLAVEIG